MHVRACARASTDDRFWEARKQWGVVTSECRTLASLACTYMTPKQALPLLSLIAAFPVVMKNYLRGERDTRRLKALLVQAEVQTLATVVNQPQYVLSRLRQLAHRYGRAQQGLEILRLSFVAAAAFAAIVARQDFVVVLIALGCVEIKICGVFVLNRRVDLHAIDATPA